MKQITDPAGLRRELDRHRERTRGLVPTMGALHRGHISLIERSKAENDITIVSIFVNPTQFNNPDDLAKYPRDLAADIDKLSQILDDGDIVFTPGAEDIYRDEEMPAINLGHLNTVMEGQHRPGHFMGVVRIVKILFELCRPHRAYFGRKDFQQLAVVKTMVRQLGMDIQVTGCPVVREDNGLAMSSRNERLPAELRSKAGIIYSTLRKYSGQRPGDIERNGDIEKPWGIENPGYKEGAGDIEGLKEKVKQEINAVDGLNVEYFEIVDDDKLYPLRSVNDIRRGKNYTGCIAVYAGKVRLIDNMQFFFPFAKG
ncbi:MAG: pantoate--beta-alanine ligase [Bacteroidales bacterium]